MRVFVISLRTQSERRDFMRSQLERLGLEFCFFDAIDVRRTRTSYFRAFDVQRFRLNTGRKPLTNEIGCYASHLMLWRTCITLGEPIVVLEDDAGLDDRFATAMPFLERRVRDLGFIRLEKNSKREGKIAFGTRTFSARYCPNYPFSAMAYAISPDVARKFIDESRVFHSPVDKFIKDFWIHGQPLYQLSPHVVEESSFGLRTTIGERRKGGHRRLSTRVRRMGHKFLSSVHRLRFNLAYFLACFHRRPGVTAPGRFHRWLNAPRYR